MMATKMDLKGWKSETLTVEEFKGFDQHSRAMWRCKCVCGEIFVAMGSRIHRFLTTSCGCLKSEKCRKAKTKHGKSGSKLYQIWTRMIQRCENENTNEYDNYGGRGIYVCERWRNSFELFESDMGPRPKRASLDRVDNDLPYSPENCRWSDYKTQANNKRNNHILEYNGERLTISQWAIKLGVPSARLRNRLSHGWGIEEVIERPKVMSRSKASRPNSNSFKQYARHQVQIALEYRRITKPHHCQHPNCQETKIQAHHHRGYEPKHALDVIWVCSKHHRREWEITITALGETYTLGEWSLMYGVPKATIKSRLRSPYWTVDDAVWVPVGERKGGPKPK